MVSQAKSCSGLRSTANCSKISARSARGLRGSAVQHAADVEQDLGDARGGRRRLGHRRVGRRSARPSPRRRCTSRRRSSAARAHRRPCRGGAGRRRPRRRRAAPTDRASTARRYLASAAALSPAISSICASITTTGAWARSPCRASAWRAARARAAKSFCAGLQPGHARTRAADRAGSPRRCGRAAARRRDSRPLDLLDGQHEIGEPVARPRRQDLRRKLRGGVDPAGIDAQPEGGVDAARDRRAPAPARGRAGRRRSRSRGPARPRGRRDSGRSSEIEATCRPADCACAAAWPPPDWASTGERSGKQRAPPTAARREWVACLLTCWGSWARRHLPAPSSRCSAPDP